MKKIVSTINNALLQERLEMVLNRFGVFFQGTAGIQVDGQLKACVTANPLNKCDPIGADTAFPVGSVTKLFVAIVVHKLCEDPNFDLSLDTPLSTYYPDLRGGDIYKIRHVLGHQAPLYDVSNQFDFNRKTDQNDFIQTIIENTQGDPVREETCYNNSGFILLGRILELETGQSWDNCIQTFVSEPLGLTQTKFGRPDIESYMLEGSLDHSKISGRFEPRSCHAAGGLLSSMSDLFKLYNELDAAQNGRGTCISKLTATRLFTPVTDGPEANGKTRCLGGRLQESYGIKTAGHDGDITEMFMCISMTFKHQDKRYTVVILSNQAPRSVFEIRDGIMSLLTQQPFAPPKLLTQVSGYSSDEIEQYVGSYYSEQLGLSKELVNQNGSLVFKTSGRVLHRDKDAPDTFYNLNAQRKLVFDRDARGEVVGYTFFLRHPVRFLKKGAALL